MAKTIWNEGRVVGFSAYEEYVKKALAEDPESEPASEREWLASSLATGSSMIVKVPAESNTTANNKPHYIDIPFPSDTRLCAANPIYAYFYDGTAVYEDGSAWAVGLAKASQLIENDSSVHPSGSISSTQSSKISTNLQIKTTVAGETSGSGEQTTVTDEVKIQIAQYMKIEDGIVIQPGSWEHKSDTPTEDGAPYSSLEPNMAGYPTLRLLVNGRVENDFQILMTAFTNRIVVMGESALTADTGRTGSPQDGDYLGPATFPWCAKVFFNVSPAQVNTGNAIYSSNDDGSVNNGNIHIEKTDDGYEITVKKQITSVSESGSNINSSGDYTTTTDNEHKVSNPALTVKPLDNEQKNHTELTWGREVLREETNPSYNSIIDEDTNLLDMTPNAEAKPEENKYGDSIALNIRKAVYSYPDSVMRNYLTIGHFTTHNITSVSSTGAIDSSIASSDNGTQPQYKGNSYIDNAFVAITADNAKNIVADNVGSAVSVNATGDGITLASTKSTSSSGVTFTITGSLAATVNNKTNANILSVDNGIINLNTINLIKSSSLIVDVNSDGTLDIETVDSSDFSYRFPYRVGYYTYDVSSGTGTTNWYYATAAETSSGTRRYVGPMTSEEQPYMYSVMFYRYVSDSSSVTTTTCNGFGMDSRDSTTSMEETHTFTRPSFIPIPCIATADAAGNLVSLSVQVGSSSTYGSYFRHIGAMDGYNTNSEGETDARHRYRFAFRHTQTSDVAQAQSNMYYVEIHNGTFTDIATDNTITVPVQSYSINTQYGASRVWNVAGYATSSSGSNISGASWDVTCGSNLGTGSGSLSNYTVRATIYASGISDGYNSQYYRHETGTRTNFNSADHHFYDSGHLNHTATITFS